MKLLTMMLMNLWGGSRTVRFPDRPPVSAHYRGLVLFDPELCVGCGMCKNRCPSRAIEFTPGKGDFTWSYNPGQCTFCGRCVDGCKPHALSQESACPPIYLTAGELKKTYTVARKRPAPKQPQAASAAASEPISNPTPGGAQ